MRVMKSFLWETKPYRQPYRISRQPELVFRWHHHSYWEIFGVVSGGGQVLAGDFHCRFQPGEVYVAGPGLPHAFFALTNPELEQAAGDFFVFTIDLSELASLFDPQALRGWQQAGSGGLCYRGDVADQILDMLSAADRADGVAQSIAALQVVERLMKAPRPKPLTKLHFSEEPSKRDADRMDKVLRYLHGHLTEALSLSALAGIAGVSEKTLSRIFKKSTGQTVVEYLNRLRVSEACRQLISTDRPVTQIAYDCGFGSLSSFNRMFSRYEDIAPSAYRREHL